jgi:hypothetical protein
LIEKLSGLMRPARLNHVMQPGTVDTPVTGPCSAKYDARPAPEAAARLHEVIEARGAHETGQFFDQNGRVVPW